ncbi:MAG TPA: branched-chain amino acid ABC transporter permease [Tepidisphaeraceae bacterium]|jgi:branched-chain amino acid transport system permease protein|nr:branched-chain amino acid ABC transporter permease [Tepidisphaeraceae bacterium]
MEEFLQQLVNGLSYGAIIALIAVGYTMVYGVLRLINFAHGDVYMLGAMFAFYAATNWFGLSAEPTWPKFFLILLVAMTLCGIVGFLIERLAYRPLRDAPRINSLITAIGVSLFIQYGGQQTAVFGPNPRSFPQIIPNISGELFNIHGVTVSKVDALILVVTVVLMSALTYLVMFTRTGLALRAVSFRFDTAALMGIPINRIISFTFVLGSVLAAAAGVLVAIKYPKVDPLMGLMPGVKAFVAAVLGGIGNIPGAVCGGLLLGLTEVLVAGYLPKGSQYKDGVAFVILIAVLLVKPSGLLGKNTIEKV